MSEWFLDPSVGSGTPPGIPDSPVTWDTLPPEAAIGWDIEVAHEGWVPRLRYYLRWELHHTRMDNYEDRYEASGKSQLWARPPMCKSPIVCACRIWDGEHWVQASHEEHERAAGHVTVKGIPIRISQSSGVSKMMTLDES